MKIKELYSNVIVRKAISIVLLVTIALLSIFVISKPATSPETYKATIQSIDDKKSTVMGVSAVAATAATTLALLPTDATTPVAEQIMEVASYLFIVVCVLVLEKSLLTVMGYISFNILIPIACALLGAYTFVKKKTLKILAFKVVIFALVILVIIPLSQKIGDMIFEINGTDTKHVVDDLSESVKLDNIKSETDTEEDDKNWLEKISDKLSDATSAVVKKAKAILNKFIDTIALFIIAYCAIPIIVVLLIVWLIKYLFGIAVPVPSANKLNLFKKRKKETNSEEIIEIKQ